MSCALLLSASAADIKEASVRDGDEYLGREFNPDFDKLFDNFERATLDGVTGTGLWWAFNESSDVKLTERISYLEANYSTTVGISKDAPIYKVASPSNTSGSYDYLVLIMKGTNGAKIEDLVMSFRYDDNYEDLDVNFTDLVDPDTDFLPELTNEYQVYIINLADSLDGKVFNRLSGKQGPETIDASKSLAGFHFMSKTTGDGYGTLGIREVYWSKSSTTLGYVEGTDNFLLDNFNRTDVGAADSNVWWRGAGQGSSIIGKWLAIDYTTNPAHYRSAGYDNSNVTSEYENFVLRIKGKVGEEDLLITPFYVIDSVDTWGTPIALSELKGPDSELVPAVTNGFQNIVVNFEANNWAKNVNGFKFESKTGENGFVYLDTIFFTNMEYDASTVITTYPILNPDDLVVFDSFDRETVGATAEYTTDNEVATENGLSFIIAYAGIDRMSIEDGALVLDASTNSDYLQYTTAGIYNNDGTYKYVVFKVKVTDGGSLNNFRIATIDATDNRSTVVWANGGLKSGTGLVTPQYEDENYPYVNEDGFMYLIVDLAASNLTTTINGFDLYYGGAGKLHIDSIFFANQGSPILDEENELMFDDFNRAVLKPVVADLFAEINKWYLDSENASIIENALVLNATEKVHSYYKTAGYPNNADAPKQYLVLKMKGTEGTTLDSFRISTITGDGESAPRFANANHLVSFPGVVIPALTTEYQTYIIDLEASNLPVNAQGVTITIGDWASGIITIDEIYFADSVDYNVVMDLAVELASIREEEPVDPEDPVATTNQQTTNSTQTTGTTKPVDESDGGNTFLLIVLGIIGLSLVGSGAFIIIRKRA
jgi:hypothetical protein